jgi:hypothetical protein
MTYAPTQHLDVPPYQLHPLIPNVIGELGLYSGLSIVALSDFISAGFNASARTTPVEVSCAQGLGGLHCILISLVCMCKSD